MPTSTLAQANKANLAAKADHEIRVELDQQKVYVVAHFPGPMNLGETVHCSSNDGTVEIYFDVDGSPFLNLDNTTPKTEIDSNDPPLELKTPGTFTGRCYLKTSDGVHSYNPRRPRAGGDMIVRP